MMMKKIILFLIVFSGVLFCAATVGAQTLEEYLNDVTIPTSIYSDMMYRKYSDKQPSQETVSVDSGEFSYRQTDYTLPGVNGLNVDITRIYNSGTALKYKMSAGISGNQIVETVRSNWSMDGYLSFYEERYNLGIGQRLSIPTMEVSGDAKYLHSDNGGVFRMIKSDETSSEIIYKAEGAEIDEFEIRECKNFNQANTTNYYLYNGATGYNEQADGRAKYKLIQKDGLTMYFSGSFEDDINDEGRILSIEDRYQNRILFQYLTDTYEFNKKRRLISVIKDTLDRTITFTYTSDSAYTVPSDNNLNGKFQTVITMPNGQKIVYDKASFDKHDNKSTKEYIERVYLTDANYSGNVSQISSIAQYMRYLYGYVQNDIGFVFASKPGYPALNKTINVNLIDYRDSNKVKKYTYIYGKKHMRQTGHIQYMQVETDEEMSVTNINPNASNLADKYTGDTVSKKRYNYEGLPQGYGGLAVDFENSSDLSTYFKSGYTGWYRTGAEGYESPCSLKTLNAQNAIEIYVEIIRPCTLTFYQKATGVKNSSGGTLRVYVRSTVVYEKKFDQNTDWEKASIDIPEGHYDMKFEFTRAENDVTSFAFLDDIRFDSYSTVWVTDDMENREMKTVTKYVTDNNHQLVQKMVVGDDHYSVDKYTYKGKNVSSITSVTNTKDADGYFRSVAAPSYQSYKYDGYGNLLSYTANDQVKYSYTYDTNKYHAVTSSVVYDLTGGSAVEKERTEYQNDTYGNATLVRKKNPSLADVVSEYKYDYTDGEEGRGNLISENTYTVGDDKNTVEKQYSYYEGAYLASKDELVHHTSYEYDYNTGNMTKVKTKNNSGVNGAEVELTTQYSYDRFGRLRSTRFPDATTENYDYFDSKTDNKRLDVRGRYHGLGNLIDYCKTYLYDTRGNLVEEYVSGYETPKHVLKKYEYDCFGNLTKMTDGNNNEICWQYDSANRPVKKEYVNPNGENDTVTLNYATNNADVGFEAFDKVLQVSSGNRFNVLLNYDHTIYAFGDNSYGQCGYEGPSSTEPHLVPTTNFLADVAAGKDWALALDYYGGVLAWGRNTEGHLGRGTISHHESNPGIVSGLGFNVTAIACGNGHSLAIKDGKVWAWGYNGQGQLGNGTTTNQSTPVQVLTVDSSGNDEVLSNVKAIACGNNTSYAVTQNGDVYAWGQNNAYQIGDGTKTNRSKAKKVIFSDIHNITKIAAGAGGVMVVRNDGRIFGWGENSYGQLLYTRYGAATALQTPVSYNDSTNNADIYAGSENYYIIKSNGSLMVTGKNHFFNIDREVNGERIVEGVSNVGQVSAGIDMAVVLCSDSMNAYLYGRNGWEQESYLNRDYPFMNILSVQGTGGTPGCVGTVGVTDEEGYETKTYYDVNKRIINESKTNTDPFMFVYTTYEYDYRGNVTKITDPNGNQTSYTYDALGRPYQKTDALGNVTTTLYTCDNLLARMDEPGGRSTGYWYKDGLVSQVRTGNTSEIDSKYHYISHSYDKSGNRVSEQAGYYQGDEWHSLKTSTYTYNNMNQLIQKQTQTGDGAVFDKVEYTYEPFGNVQYEKHYGNDSGSQRIEKSYLYDYNQKVVQAVESATYNNALQGRKVTQYERDPVGNILKQKVKNGGNETDETGMTSLDTTYEYDYRSRMVKMVEPAGSTGSTDTKTTTFAYNKKGNLAAKTVTKSGVQVTEEYLYNILDKVTCKKVKSGNDVVAELYSYDDNGNLVKKYDARNEGIENLTYISDYNSGNYDYTAYEYDALNRRTKTVYKGDVMEYIEYDGRGNITLKADGEGYDSTNPAASAGDRFTYDAWNNVVSVKPADAPTRSMTYEYDSLGNRVSQTDYYNNTTAYEYYGNGLIKNITYEPGVTESFAYDMTGKLRKESTDRNNNTTKIYYNVFGDPYKTEYPDGTTQTTGYCVYLGLALVVNRKKRQDEDLSLGSITYAYDRDSNVVESKKLMEIDGNTRVYSVKRMTYDEMGNMLSANSLKRTEGSGATPSEVPVNDTVTYTYDMFNRITRSQGPNGRETLNTYDKNGNLVQEKAKISNGVYATTNYEYDGLNRMTSKKVPLSSVDVFKFSDSSSYSEAVTSYTYYKNNNTKTITDPYGNVTAYEYNHAGKVTKMTTPLNDSTTYAYDLNGNLVSETNANGKTTSYEYDRYSRLTKQTEPDGAQTRYQYDAMGNLIKQILPNQTDGGFVYTYDTMNRKLSETNADGSLVQTYTYDSNGNISAAYNGSGLLCYSYAYDQNDNLIKKTDFEGNTTSYEYDVSGNVTRQTDANHHATTYAYNPDSTLSRVNYPDGGQVEYAYDGLGRKTSETKKMNGTASATTAYKYNWIGAVSESTDAVGTVSKYYYDLNGNLTKTTIGNDISAIYVYDASNRLVQKQTPVDQNQTNYRDYTYDGAGNVLTDTVSNGSDNDPDARGLSYTYYDSGKVYTVSENGVLMTKYYYDLNKNVTRIEQTRDADSSDVVEYEYDSNNRVTKERRFMEQASIADENAAGAADGLYVSQKQYRYDVYGNLIRSAEPDAAVKEYGYDRLNRLSYELFEYDSQSRAKKTYEYDGAGNLIRLSEVGQTVQKENKSAGGDNTYQLNTYTSAAVHSTSYTYDSMNRVVSVTDPLNNVVSYTYDYAGNQTSVTDALGAYTYTYDLLGRLKTIRSPNNVVISTKEYDVRGNLISDTDGRNLKTEYEYNKVNKVTKVKQPAGNFVTYAYNIFGECVSMTDGEGNTTRYAYDAYGNLTSVTDPLNVQITYTYDYAKNLTSMTDGNGHMTQYEYASFNRLVRTVDAAGEDKKYKYDLSGNTVAVTDETGGTTSYAYDKRSNLIHREYTDGADAISYTYDYFGNRVGMSDATGASTYTYDALNRLLEIKKNDAVQLVYTYDAVGNILSVTDGSGNTTTYTYDLSLIHI